MITRLNTVTVYVSDQDRSLDFYFDKLGFEKRADRDMGLSGRWMVGSAADLIFVTDDVDEAHKALAERDVSVTEPQVQAWS